MTSASVPVSSAPASSRQSFLVHLQSLTGFSQELRTQADGIAKPADQVAGMSADPPAFGPFSEATALTSRSQTATTQMEGLLSDVRQAMQFADEVTRTVATGYREADDDVAWGIGGRAPVGTVLDVATAPVTAVGSAVGGITAGLTHTVGRTVDGVVGDVVATGRHALTDVGQGVGSILGALTGSQPGPGAV